MQLNSSSLQHLTPSLPILAPFLDRMTTRHVARRFSASEALQFFEAFQAELSEEQLQTSVSEHDTLRGEVPYDKFDRWEGLPESFVARWSTFREPGLPWTTKALRLVCNYTVGHMVVQWVRRIHRLALSSKLRK